MSRGAVLTASRVSNFAILMLSPLLLVRILDVEAYGKYQEFMIYATLLVALCTFSMNRGLTYFLPRYPEREREFLFQNTVLILITSSAFLTLLIVARPLFLKIANHDFLDPLAIYVFCFVNLNWLEYYWIAKKRTDLVLYYSAARLFVRVAVLLIVAYVTRDVDAIIWSVVAVEALRLFLVAAFLLKARLLVASLDLECAKEQVRFAGPLGLAAFMQNGGRNIGKLYVGAVLGPVALAHYAVASYLLRVVRVVRDSIADAVFPELVRARHDPDIALRLWQRSNIVFCIFLFPPFVLLTWYAELFITTLFTDDYLPAVPVFQIYLLWLLRRCFNMDTLLRTRGRTRFMLTGTGYAVALNLLLMVVLYNWLGLIGPAIAYITSEILLEVYYAVLVKREFHLKASELVDLAGIRRIALGCLAGIPLLAGAEYLPGPEALRAVIASLAFIAVCWVVAYRMGVSDIGHIARFARSRVRKFA